MTLPTPYPLQGPAAPVEGAANARESGGFDGEAVRLGFAMLASLPLLLALGCGDREAAIERCRPICGDARPEVSLLIGGGYVCECIVSALPSREDSP